jgi:hypothetical protein
MTARTSAVAQNMAVALWNISIRATCCAADIFQFSCAITTFEWKEVTLLKWKEME